ncbi:MAG TPA: HAD family hydrolase [Bacteroidaceae bacterium]|nr:HAD family hydrolase [Bacteroidaceae bacterium]
MIKGIIFDYGGTIDTDGVHWFELLRRAYGVFLCDMPEDVLLQAYIYAERTLGAEDVIKSEDNFSVTLRKKIELQFNYLINNHGYTVNSVQKNSIINYSIDYVRENIEKNSAIVLSTLSEIYPMVIVSNFYGNLDSVLHEFGIDSYFSSVIESSRVGIRKPDPAIFLMGVKALKNIVDDIISEQILVIGDSFQKDIVPAWSIGCVTAWLKGVPFGNEPHNVFEPSYTISTLKELSSIKELFTDSNRI